MRKLISIVAFIIATSNVQAQDFSLGIKGGTNYNFSGDLKELNILNIDTDDILHKAKSVQGYHGGVWVKYGEDTFIRAEAIYTHFENEFSDPTIYTIITNKVDIPVVLGVKILGPLYVFGGPDFQYVLNEEFLDSNVSISKEDLKDFTTGLHLGVGVALGRLALELRWDKGLSESTINIVNSDNYNFTIDNRPNQLVLSLNLALSNSD